MESTKTCSCIRVTPSCALSIVPRTVFTMTSYLAYKKLVRAFLPSPCASTRDVLSSPVEAQREKRCSTISRFACAPCFGATLSSANSTTS